MQEREKVWGSRVTGTHTHLFITSVVLNKSDGGQPQYPIPECQWIERHQEEKISFKIFKII